MNQPVTRSEKFVAFLRSEIWAFISFTVIIIPLMVHTQHLMLEVTGIKFNLFGIDENAYALFFAFGFDLAIFNFAINGRKSEATGLAFVVFLLNAFFLNLDLLYTIGTEGVNMQKLWVNLMITLTIAATSAWIVHAYVCFFVDKIGAKERIKNLLEKSHKQDIGHRREIEEFGKKHNLQLLELKDELEKEKEMRISTVRDMEKENNNLALRLELKSIEKPHVVVAPELLHATNGNTTNGHEESSESGNNASSEEMSSFVGITCGDCKATKSSQSAFNGMRGACDTCQTKKANGEELTPGVVV